MIRLFSCSEIYFSPQSDSMIQKKEGSRLVYSFLIVPFPLPHIGFVAYIGHKSKPTNQYLQPTEDEGWDQLLILVRTMVKSNVNLKVN